MLDQGNLQFSLEVKPLSYVDERKFYTCADAAYKIYEQLSKNKVLKSSAWCMANAAMFSWYLKSLFGFTFTSREVERAVDLALRSPTYFMVKSCLIGALQAAVIVGGSVLGFSSLGLSEPQRHIITFYLLSMIIQFVKLWFRVRKGSSMEVDSASRPLAVS